MRRVLTPVRSEEEIRVPYECESNTEKTLFMTLADMYGVWHVCPKPKPKSELDFSRSL